MVCREQRVINTFHFPQRAVPATATFSTAYKPEKDFLSTERSEMGYQGFFSSTSQLRCRFDTWIFRIWSRFLYCNLVIPQEIDLFLHNHSISQKEVIIMMNDDDPPSHFMIQSSQQIWSAATCQICLNPVWRVGCEVERSTADR